MSEVQKVQIDSVEPHPDNARKGDVNAIARSLERFGQVPGSVAVQRSTNLIVKGNHTWKAAKQLGWEYIDVIVLDMDDATARAYLIADNAVSDRATYDEGKLLGLLGKSLANLEGTGFTEEDFEMLSEELNAPAEAPGARREVEFEDREVDDEGPEPTREIPLRISAGKIEAFAEQVNDLLAMWQLGTFADVVLRAIGEAHDRWQAGHGVVGRPDSSEALPPELRAGEDF